MEFFSTIIVSIFAFIGGLVSSFLMFRGQKINALVEQGHVATEQVESIFDGYSQMVEDLQNEVGRLKLTIDGLRIEQEACEVRNAMLHQEIIDLRKRILSLEKKEARDAK